METNAVPKVGEKAADFVLRATDGRKISLSGLAAGGPALLIVHRGRGDPDSVRALCEYRDVALHFHRAGVELAALSAEPAEVAGWLAIERGISFPLLCDPTGEAIARLGLGQAGEPSSVRPAVLAVRGDLTVSARDLERPLRAGGCDALLAMARRGGLGRRSRVEWLDAWVRVRGWVHQTVESIRRSLESREREA